MFHVVDSEATHKHTFKPVAFQTLILLLSDHMGWQMASIEAAQHLYEESTQY